VSQTHECLWPQTPQTRVSVSGPCVSVSVSCVSVSVSCVSVSVSYVSVSVSCVSVSVSCVSVSVSCVSVSVTDTVSGSVADTRVSECLRPTLECLEWPTLTDT
jgi:hypothetical protein